MFQKYRISRLQVDKKIEKTARHNVKNFHCKKHFGKILISNGCIGTATDNKVVDTLSQFYKH